MRNQMERHMFDIDYMSIEYGPTHQKLIQDIMKCSIWTKWTHFRPIQGKNMNHQAVGASNDELNGKKRIYC